MFEQDIFKPTIGDLCDFFDTAKMVYGAIKRKELRNYPDYSHCKWCWYKDCCPYEK